MSTQCTTVVKISENETALNCGFGFAIKSWVNDNNKNLNTIEGYDVFHNVPCDGRRGGGLSVYIWNVYKSEVIQQCTISLQTIETLFI